MREDKLLRTGTDTGLHGTLMRAAKRAVLRADKAALDKVNDHVESLLSLAAGDQSALRECRELQRGIKRIESQSGTALVMETKAVVQLRPTETYEDDIPEANGEPLVEIVGYGSTFGNVDLGGDIVMPGAFTRTLNDWRTKRGGRLPAMLAVHDGKIFPVGAWSSMTEDSTGLKVSGYLANTPRGREALALIQMQPSALDGLSIGYSVRKDDYDRAGNRLLLDVDLYEVSLVHLPMNEQSRFGVAKADAVDASLKKLRTALEKQPDSNVLRIFPQRPELEADDELAAARALEALASTIQRFNR